MYPETDGGIFNNEGGSSGSRLSHIELRGSGTYFYCETDENCNHFNFNLGTTDLRNKWGHYAIVFNEARAYLYIDGDYWGEASTYGDEYCGGPDADCMVTDTTLRYVGSATYQNNFQGKIQNIRIYDINLTSEEINILYNITNPNKDQKMILSNNSCIYTGNELIEY